MSVVTSNFDSLTIENLRNTIGAKWTAYPGCIGAWVAEMDFGAAPVIQAALREVIDSGYMGYLPNNVKRDMQEATAGWYRRNAGWELPPERVHPLPDVVKGLQVAIEHFSAPGSKVIVPTPAYMPFLTVPVEMGREKIEVPSFVEGGHWQFDYDGIDAAFASGGGLLVLCNPANPLGRVLERHELERLSEIVAKYEGRVFADEIHAPLIYPGRSHIPYVSVSEIAASHTVTTLSASKAWNLAGLKCAQLIVSNEADQALWAEIGYLAGHGASTLGVIANTVAYNEGEPWLQDVLEYLDGNRQLLADLLAEHLPAVDYLQPEGTYLAWLDFRRTGLDGELDLFFRENAKVAIVDGSHCGEAGKGFVRFNIATSRQIMTQAIEQMAVAVRSSRFEVRSS